MVGLPQIAIVFNELLNAFSFFSGNDKEHALVCVKPDWSARLGRPRTGSDSGHSTKDCRLALKKIHWKCSTRGSAVCLPDT